MGKENITVINGIDIDKALVYFDGDMETFREILSVACQDADAKLSRLKKAFEEKNLSAYQLEVHSIKSSAGIFGMEQLAEHARKHETAAKEQNMDFIVSDYENLSEEYKKFISEATIYLGK